MSLIAKDPEGCLLANLFNSFLVRRKVPEIFKHKRSILLLKGTGAGGRRQLATSHDFICRSPVIHEPVGKVSVNHLRIEP